jgi:hypothetical protein
MRPREALSQLTAAIIEILKVHHISLQRYWNATLVEPLTSGGFLRLTWRSLRCSLQKKTASKGAAAAAEFTATHSRVLELSASSGEPLHADD